MVQTPDDRAALADLAEEQLQHAGRRLVPREIELRLLRRPLQEAAQLRLQPHLHLQTAGLDPGLSEERPGVLQAVEPGALGRPPRLDAQARRNLLPEQRRLLAAAVSLLGRRNLQHGVSPAEAAGGSEVLVLKLRHSRGVALACLQATVEVLAGRPGALLLRKLPPGVADRAHHRLAHASHLPHRHTRTGRGTHASSLVDPALVRRREQHRARRLVGAQESQGGQGRPSLGHSPGEVLFAVHSQLVHAEEAQHRAVAYAPVPGGGGGGEAVVAQVLLQVRLHVLPHALLGLVLLPLVHGVVVEILALVEDHVQRQSPRPLEHVEAGARLLGKAGAPGVQRDAVGTQHAQQPLLLAQLQWQAARHLLVQQPRGDVAEEHRLHAVHQELDPVVPHELLHRLHVGHRPVHGEEVPDLVAGRKAAAPQLVHHLLLLQKDLQGPLFKEAMQELVPLAPRRKQQHALAVALVHLGVAEEHDVDGAVLAGEPLQPLGPGLLLRRAFQLRKGAAEASELRPAHLFHQALRGEVLRGEGRGLELGEDRPQVQLVDPLLQGDVPPVENLPQ